MVEREARDWVRLAKGALWMRKLERKLLELGELKELWWARALQSAWLDRTRA